REGAISRPKLRILGGNFVKSWRRRRALSRFNSPEMRLTSVFPIYSRIARDHRTANSALCRLHVDHARHRLDGPADLRRDLEFPRQAHFAVGRAFLPEAEHPHLALALRLEPS